MVEFDINVNNDMRIIITLIPNKKKKIWSAEIANQNC